MALLRPPRKGITAWSLRRAAPIVADMAESLLAAIRRYVPMSLVEATRPLRLYFHPQRRFDRRWGVETSTCVDVEDLGLDDATRAHSSGYEPTRRSEFARVMRTLGRPLDRYTFVDLGSGKGAALLYAMEYPFRRIVGVELTANLHRIAQQNIARMSALRPRLDAGRVQNLCMNVADFRFPDEPILCFLYNPFKGKTLDTVVDNLRQSLARSSRDVAVIYLHTLSRHGAWDGAEFLAMERREPRFTIYTSRTARAGE